MAENRLKQSVGIVGCPELPTQAGGSDLSDSFNHRPYSHQVSVPDLTHRAVAADQPQ